MKQRKLISLLLAAILMLSLTGIAASAEEPKKLVIGIRSFSMVTDYEINYLTQLVEEKLGCDLEFMLFPNDLSEMQAKIAVMASAPKELPDILLSEFTLEVITAYGNNGIFLDLSEYVNDAEKMPNFNAIPAEYKQYLMNATSSVEGKTFSLGSFTAAPWDQTPYRIYINETWLNKLGLKMPTTTEEFHEVLKAFATQDPNGNGVADEMPLYGVTHGGWGNNPLTAIMNSFVYYNPDTQNGLALDETGEKVIAPFTSDSFKQGLIYMNELYADGLIPDSIFTDDTTLFKATINNEACNLVGAVVTGSYGNWTDAATNANFNEMALLEPLTGPEGVKYTPWNDYTLQRNMVITCNCKDVDLAIAFGDLFYDSEMSIATRFGEKDIDWTTDPSVLEKYTSHTVEAGLAEMASIYLYNDIWAQQTNKTWHGETPRFSDPLFNYTDETMLKDTFETDGAFQKTNIARINDMKTYFFDRPKYIIPDLVYTEEESEIVGEVTMYVNDYLAQSIAQFVTGERDIERDWDNYLKELDNMGLQDWLLAAQAACDRAK